MRFTKTNKDVRWGKRYNKLEMELKEFMNMNTRVVEVSLSEGEYKSVTSAQASVVKAIKRYALPIKAVVRKHTLYLVRTDMD